MHKNSWLHANGFSLTLKHWSSFVFKTSSRRLKSNYTWQNSTVGENYSSFTVNKYANDFKNSNIFSDIQDMHISPNFTRLGSKICAQFFIFSPVCNEVKNPLHDGFSSGKPSSFSSSSLFHRYSYSILWELIFFTVVNFIRTRILTKNSLVIFHRSLLSSSSVIMMKIMVSSLAQQHKKEADLIISTFCCLLANWQKFQS